MHQILWNWMTNLTWDVKRSEISNWESGDVQVEVVLVPWILLWVLNRCGEIIELIWMSSEYEKWSCEIFKFLVVLTYVHMYVHERCKFSWVRIAVNLDSYLVPRTVTQWPRVHYRQVQSATRRQPMLEVMATSYSSLGNGLRLPWFSPLFIMVFLVIRLPLIFSFSFCKVVWSSALSFAFINAVTVIAADLLPSLKPFKWLH